MTIPPAARPAQGEHSASMIEGSSGDNKQKDSRSNRDHVKITGIDAFASVTEGELESGRFA